MRYGSARPVAADGVFRGSENCHQCGKSTGHADQHAVVTQVVAQVLGLELRIKQMARFALLQPGRIKGICASINFGSDRGHHRGSLSSTGRDWCDVLEITRVAAARFDAYYGQGLAG